MVSKQFLSVSIYLAIMITLSGFAYMFFTEPSLFKHQIFPVVYGMDNRVRRLEDSVVDLKDKMKQQQISLDILRHKKHHDDKRGEHKDVFK